MPHLQRPGRTALGPDPTAPSETHLCYRALLAAVDNVSPVIDVWDRQWVSKKFEKVRPASADIFVFAFRMLADKSEMLLAKSGQHGIYWEPRTPCGRYPSDHFHVTWLPNMTFQDAKYAQQTSPQATTLARHGDRFGLRSDVMNAQEIHDKHRPNTPLLMGQTKMLYAVGPLPYSTTKAALHKLPEGIAVGSQALTTQRTCPRRQWSDMAHPSHRRSWTLGLFLAAWRCAHFQDPRHQAGGSSDAILNRRLKENH